MSKERGPTDSIGDAIRGSAHRTRDLAVFGDGVRRRVLNAAVGRLQGKDVTRVSLEFDLRITKRPPVVDVPDPTEIDVCYEICDSVQCYVECSNPFHLKVDPRPFTCELLWQAFREATGEAKMAAFLELVSSRCIAWPVLVKVFAVADAGNA